MPYAFKNQAISDSLREATWSRVYDFILTLPVTSGVLIEADAATNHEDAHCREGEIGVGQQTHELLCCSGIGN